MKKTDIIRPRGVFTVEHFRKGKLIHVQKCPNIVVNEGLDELLDVYFGHTAATANRYNGIYRNNYTPVAGDTMTSFIPAAGEIGATELSQTQRPTYTSASAVNQQTTNAASKSLFNFDNATALTVYGAFMVAGGAGSETFGGTTGTLFAASLFAASRVVNTGDELQITYNITLADA